jgi:amino acid adenylation domain-containing protein
VWSEFPPPEAIPSLVWRFEEQVRRHPDRPAVSFGGRALTYAELNRRANRVAHALIAALGTDPEPIALLMHQDVGVMAALWGVLKSGKYYVPLSPFDPSARQEHILEDTEARAIIVDAENVEAARTLGGERLVLPAEQLWDSGPDANPGLEIAHDAYAYVVFTSGSTGRPKGVIVDRADVLFFAREATNTFHLCPEDRLGVLGAISFSGPAPQIYGGLLNGACLCLYDLHRQDERELAPWLRAERITYCSSVPSVWRRQVEILAPDERFPDLRLIGLGGDRLYREDLRRIQQYVEPGCIIRHSLGLSEIKHVTMGFWDRESLPDTQIVPVGYPVRDTEILIVDDAGRELPAGEVGELWVRGRYMSPGYWRRPDLTARAYARDPHNPELRIYKTGDLGMIQPDGSLLLAGRADSQVKVQGQRVELSEIESALRALDGVSQAVVIAHQAGEQGPVLHAYVVMDAGVHMSAGELRRRMTGRVPTYMIPARIAFRSVLPLNNNGKVDRLALAPIGDARPELDAAYVAPRTPVEAEVAAIWQDVLSLDAVGVEDRFLDLGGQSLQAARIAGRIQDTFRVDIPASQVFAAQTVAEMSALIVQQQAAMMDEGEMEQLLALLSDLEGEGAVPGALKDG